MSRRSPLSPGLQMWSAAPSKPVVVFFIGHISRKKSYTVSMLSAPSHAGYRPGVSHFLHWLPPLDKPGDRWDQSRDAYLHFFSPQEPQITRALATTLSTLEHWLRRAGREAEAREIHIVACVGSGTSSRVMISVAELLRQFLIKRGWGEECSILYLRDDDEWTTNTRLRQHQSPVLPRPLELFTPMLAAGPPGAGNSSSGSLLFFEEGPQVRTPTLSKTSGFPTTSLSCVSEAAALRTYCRQERSFWQQPTRDNMPLPPRHHQRWQSQQ